MGKFEVGQKVHFTGEVTDMYGYKASHGEIITQSTFRPDSWLVRIFFPGQPSDEYTMWEGELAPAEAPAAADAAPAPEAVALSHTAETLAGKLVSLEMRIAVALGLPDDEFLNGDHDHMLTCIENLVHNRNAEAARLREQVRGLEAALNVAESTLYSITQRLPMTSSYKDVNMNREELRGMATKYFDTSEARATVARRGAE